MSKLRAPFACALLLLVLVAAATGVSAQPGATVEVRMVDLAYEPNTVVVAPGTKVVWLSLDPYPDDHTVTADDESFSSDLIGEGQTFSVTFEAPGVYPYFCIPHGSPGGFGMSGVVVVQ